MDTSTLNASGALRSDREDRAGAVPGVVLVFSAGAPRARALPLDGGELLIGRADTASGQVQDGRVSRQHARVQFDGRRFRVTDLGSQNGSWADGEPVAPNAPREVDRVLRVGDSLLVMSRDVRAFERLGVKTISGFVRGPSTQTVIEEAARAAQLGFTLHIRGESGTGKEGVARAFHESGPRAGGPFVAVNCAAIPQSVAERLLFGAKKGAYSGADADAPGYLQEADGGTLFLDEVVDLDLGVQAKLLRAIETREVMPVGASRARRVDIQICSATNKDMRALVAAGRLREDLYFRIGRPEVSLPPLRVRPEEIPHLLGAEVKRVAPGLALHVSLVEACLLRPWPGNVRELLAELRSAAQAALLQTAPRVEARHLSASAGTAFGKAGAGTGPTPSGPSPGQPTTSPRQVASAAAAQSQKDAAERARLEAALRENGGNVSATARALGLHRTQLRRLLERYQIKVAADED